MTRKTALHARVLLIGFSALLAHDIAAAQTLILDAAPPGKVFEGVGAVSGGGATSVLLKDYPQPQRDQILDLLFKPNFGASMQTLYVEIGGDGNSTQGTEPTHMRSADDQNYSRGYEWWLMVEAKRRNPTLALDACAWSCPGWIGNGQFWSQDMADYYVKWITGLKTAYGLDLDAVGCRNERGAATDWVKVFRATLDRNGLTRVRIHGFDNADPHKWDWLEQLQSDPKLVSAVNIFGNHTLGITTQPASVKPLAEKLGKPIWNTEEHVYDGEGRHFADDYDCALGMVHLFNDNYINHGATRIVNWYLAGSTYIVEPYADQPPALFAHEPWSGHYNVKPNIWAYAHYGQFARIGWHYVDGGCVPLAGGGSVVTLAAPAGGDYSVIAETAGAAAAQRLSFKIKPSLSHHALCVWRTLRDAQFVRQPDLTPDPDGSVNLALAPNAIYSLSTTTGQQKGTFDNVPAEKPFPLPYFDDFEQYAPPKRFGYLPHYTADICGVFEVVDRPEPQGGIAGKCLRQVVAHKSQSWAPEWMPYTVIGDEHWTDYEVSADIFFDGGGWAGVMGRISSTGNGWDGDPNGYYARLYPDGGCALYLASQKIRGSHDRQLAIGAVKDWHRNKWHNLKLRFEKQTLTLLVDNESMIVAQDAEFPKGLAGLITGGEGDARNTALFDDLRITPLDTDRVEPNRFEQNASPIYPE